VLVTAHRRENFGAGLTAIAHSLRDLAADREDMHFLWPVHPNPQVKAIVDNVLEKCRSAGLGIYHVEGYESLRWVLIDLVDVVVHVFQPEVRAYYQLERLWGDAPVERLDDDAVDATTR